MPKIFLGDLPLKHQKPQNTSGMENTLHVCDLPLLHQTQNLL